MSLATCWPQRSTCIRMSGEFGAARAATSLTTRYAVHRPLLDGGGTQQQAQHTSQPALHWAHTECKTLNCRRRMSLLR